MITSFVSLLSVSSQPTSPFLLDRRQVPPTSRYSRRYGTPFSSDHVVAKQREKDASLESQFSLQQTELDQDEMPLAAALATAAGRVRAPFFFPGHKMGRGAARPFIDDVLGGHPEMLGRDLPELKELGNLFAHDDDGPIQQAEALAAAAFGAKRTWFLANGSTAGVIAAVLACVQWHRHCDGQRRQQVEEPRSVVVLPRNVHKSAIQALILTGASPAFLMPRYDPEFDICHGVDIETDLPAALAMHGPDVAAVLLVSPTYHGAVTDVTAAARFCRAVGVPLIVDEAHGGHLQFLHKKLPPDPTGQPAIVAAAAVAAATAAAVGKAAGDTSGFPFPACPPGALQGGADLVVQSAHKTLTSLTQSALLHLGPDGFFGTPTTPETASSGERKEEEGENDGGFSIRRAVEAALEMVQSTSPSYVLLASLDAARWQLASTRRPGVALLQRAAAAAAAARARIAHIDGLAVPRVAAVAKVATAAATAGAVESCWLDPLRITVRIGDRNDVGANGRTMMMSGYEADDIMIAQFGVYAELPMERTVMFAFGPGSADADVDLLVEALEYVASVARDRRCMGATVSDATLATAAAATNAAASAGGVVFPSSTVRRQLRTPREAFFSRAETVAAADAVGRASAETVCPYPPGIPALLPGEEVTAECLEDLRRLAAAGGSFVVTGCADPSLATLRVLMSTRKLI
ncbi:unnamed protein product [Phaeothamnion confervicola]